MIVRIVNMKFREDEVQSFQEFFQEISPKIRNFPGCHHLELWQDVDDSQRFFTYSHWENTDALENYRHSELFKSFWKVAKSKFAEKAQAWSHSSILNVQS